MATAGALTLGTGCSAPKSEAEGGAEVMAAAMNAITPKDVGDGVTMTSVRAEGATLVLAFEGGSSSEFDAPDFDRQVAATLCDDSGFQRVLEKDVAMQIDFVADDGRKASVNVKDCL
ncbi:hypothetical protein [Sphingopyxis fribergensis]